MVAAFNTAGTGLVAPVNGIANLLSLKTNFINLIYQADLQINGKTIESTHSLTLPSPLSHSQMRSFSIHSSPHTCTLAESFGEAQAALARAIQVYQMISVYLSIYLPIHLPIYLSIYLSTYLSF